MTRALTLLCRYFMLRLWMCVYARFNVLSICVSEYMSEEEVRALFWQNLYWKLRRRIKLAHTSLCTHLLMKIFHINFEFAICYFLYCRITYFICLTIVLLPDSPAPVNEKNNAKLLVLNNCSILYEHCNVIYIIVPENLWRFLSKFGRITCTRVPTEYYWKGDPLIRVRKAKWCDID